MRELGKFFRTVSFAGGEVPVGDVVVVVKRAPSRE
jgi:hypothetical protein